MFLFDGAWGLNTLTSTKVLSSLPPQKPFAAMSSRVLSVVMAVRLACVRVRVRVGVRVFVCVCVRACACACASLKATKNMVF